MKPVAVLDMANELEEEVQASDRFNKEGGAKARILVRYELDRDRKSTRATKEVIFISYTLIEWLRYCHCEKSILVR
jgi:hypothetical protein